MRAQGGANGPIWSSVINTPHSELCVTNRIVYGLWEEKKIEEEKLYVRPGLRVADGWWHVIIIKLKQYLQVITELTDPGPGSHLVSLRGDYFTIKLKDYWKIVWKCSFYSTLHSPGPSPERAPALAPRAAWPRNTRLNLNENQGGTFDDLFKLTMNVPINILILMESHLEN